MHRNTPRIIFNQPTIVPYNREYSIPKYVNQDRQTPYFTFDDAPLSSYDLHSFAPFPRPTFTQTFQTFPNIPLDQFGDSEDKSIESTSSSPESLLENDDKSLPDKSFDFDPLTWQFNPILNSVGSRLLGVYRRIEEYRQTVDPRPLNSHYVKTVSDLLKEYLIQYYIYGTTARIDLSKVRPTINSEFLAIQSFDMEGMTKERLFLHQQMESIDRNEGFNGNADTSEFKFGSFEPDENKDVSPIEISILVNSRDAAIHDGFSGKKSVFGKAKEVALARAKFLKLRG